MDGHAGGARGGGRHSWKRDGWLKLLLSEISDPAFTCDQDAILRYMNEPFRHLAGKGHAGLGRPFASLFPARARRSAELASRRALAGEEAECGLAAGPAPVMFRIKPLVDSGRVFGFLGIGRPLSPAASRRKAGSAASGSTSSSRSAPPSSSARTNCSSTR